MRKIFTALTFSFITSLLFAQWSQKLSLPGTARSFSNSFTIGSKVYVAGGFDGNAPLQDFWEYDSNADTWTQGADLPLGFRSGAAGFAIAGKGYLCTGNNGFQYLNDLWEFDPATNQWLQKAPFPGSNRDEAVAFVIGNKAYVGSGQEFVVTPNNSFTITYDDFYEYDPVADSWTAKAPIPTTPRAYAVGIGLGSKGYVGLGGNDDQTISFTDFYEYDPVTDSWTSKASYTGTGRADAGIFSIGTDIYVVGGINFPAFTVTGACKKYNTLNDTWSNAPSYGGGSVIAPICANANGTVLVGTGAFASQTPRSDWWEFIAVSTSVAEIEKAAIEVYPNPFVNAIYVSAGDKFKDCSIILCDMSGKKIVEQKIFYDDELMLPTNKLASGTYTLQMINNNGKIMSQQKIIKK